MGPQRRGTEGRTGGGTVAWDFMEQIKALSSRPTTVTRLSARLKATPPHSPVSLAGWSDEGLKGKKNARREHLGFTAGDTAAPLNASSLERFGAH